MVPTPAAAACADTVIVRAAKTYTMPGSAQITFVEPCTLSAVSGRRFLIEVVRPGASNPLISAEIAFGGVVYFGVDDVDNANVLISRVVTASGVGELKVTLKGSAGAHVVVRISHVNESLYSVYSPSPFTGATTAKTSTKYFSFESTPSAPHLMTLTNGNADATGAARTYNAEVWLNSQQVVLPSELTLGRAFVTRDVLLDSVNVLQVNLIANQGGKKLSIKFSATDTISSGLTVEMPSDSLVTAAAKVLATAQIENAKADTRLFVNGTEKAVGVSSWSDSLSLAAQDGKNTFVFTANRVECSPVLTVFRDTQAPVMEILSPAPEVMAAPTTQDTITFVIRVTDLTRTGVFVDGDEVGFVPLGAGFEDFTVQVPLDLGSNRIHFRAIDQLGDTTRLDRLIQRVAVDEPAPVSASVVPHGMPTTVASTFWEQVRFLWGGTPPLQAGADTTKMSAERLAVIRGRVIARELGALPHVQVRVLGHEEFGYALTREDGAFDLAVNGGAPLTLRYTKPGFLESQRVVDTAPLDFAQVADVAMLGESTRKYAVNTATPQKVVSRFETDGNGDRRLTMLFEAGARCTLSGNGQQQVLTEFQVRAKEYTVGSGGDEAMPGTLPPSSAYTYCVNLSLVEADALVSPNGAPPTMEFSKPVVTYVREFLGVPVGSIVPSGAYDFVTGAWVPSEDGVVVRIINRGQGVANLDTDGDHEPDSAARYEALGVTAVEAEQIAAEYAYEDVLWRVRLDHFSPHDYNFNQAAVATAQAQSPAGVTSLGTVITDPELTCACVIENENRVLGETIPIVGTPYSLHYRSSRQPGDVAMRWLHIPLLGATPPADLVRVHVTVDIAGRRFWRIFTVAEAGTPWDCKDWDGTDVYGRAVNGSVPATVRRGYEFLQEMRVSGGSPGPGWFGNSSEPGSESITAGGDRAVGRILWTTQKVAVGVPSMAAAGLGGWTISPHHIYDPNGMGMKYRGDGSLQRGTGQFPVIKAWAGTGVSSGPLAEGFPLRGISIAPSGQISVGPDGAVYIANDSDSPDRILRISESGGIERIVGGGTAAFTSGVLALSLSLTSPRSPLVAPDGSIYFIETAPGTRRVYRVSPGDTAARQVWHVAGNPTVGFADDSLATTVSIGEPISLALGPEGVLYIGAQAGVVYRVGTNGRITRYAGGGAGAYGATGAARAVRIHPPLGMVADAGGNLYLTEAGGAGAVGRIRRVSPDGLISTVATLLNLEPTSVALGPDGRLYFTQSFGVISGQKSVYRLESDGTWSTVAGGNAPGPGGHFNTQDGVSARAALFSSSLGGIALDARGNLYIAELPGGLHKVFTEFPTQVQGEVAFPEEDGRSVDIFSVAGRHLRTVDAITGDTLFLFGYDLDGRLTSITDSNDDVTVIQRAGGAPTGIVAPRGQVTALGLEGNFLHTVTNPANQSITLGYESGGLLTSLTNARDATWAYHYSTADGRLDYEAAPASGGGQDLKHREFSETQVSATRTVTQETPEGRVTEYAVTQMLDGLRQRLVRRPNVSQQYSDTRFRAVSPYGQQDSTAFRTGETFISRPQRDPKYGWWAPVDAYQEVKLPVSGQRRFVTRTRTWSESQFEDNTWVNGKQFTSTYDIAQRLLTTKTPLNRTTTATFDMAGRPTHVLAPGLAEVVLDYDSFGRLWHLTQLSRSWTYEYDNLGQLQRVRSAAGDTTRYEHDPAGRVTALELPGARRVEFGYDAAGNMQLLRTPRGHEHGFTYYPVNLNEHYVPPTVTGVPSPMTAYEFDSDQLLTRSTRPDGGVIDLTYESTPNSGRVGRIEFPNADLLGTRERTDFTYKPDAGSGAGLLASANRVGHAMTTYGYDGSQPTSEQWSGRVQGAVTRTYDEFFRPATETVSAGSNNRTVAFTYDDDGLLTDIDASDGSWVYDLHRSLATGMLDSTRVQPTAGVAVTSSADYDEYGDLRNLRYAVGGAELFQQSIRHDSRGRVDAISERWNGGTPTERTYSYDAAGRLSAVRENLVLRREYEYDANGNRTKETRRAADGSVEVVSVGEYDAQDRLLTYGAGAGGLMDGLVAGDSLVFEGYHAYEYTANGELKRRTLHGPGGTAPADAFRYDAMGALMRAVVPSVAGTETLSFTLDGQNRRVAAYREGAFERGWLYDGIAVMAELSDSVTLRHRYVYGTRGHAPDLLWDADSAVVYRLITDQLGSVRAVVRTSDGATVQRTDYDAWGEITAETNGTFQSLGYAGGLTDRTTGLVRFGARDYEPGVGRWTCKDPTGFGVSYESLYLYAGGAPTVYTDDGGESYDKPDCERWRSELIKIAKKLNARYREMANASCPDRGHKKAIEQLLPIYRKLKDRYERYCGPIPPDAMLDIPATLKRIVQPFLDAYQKRIQPIGPRPVGPSIPGVPPVWGPIPYPVLVP
ncbi:MAG: hypothetical protein IT348_13560 [Candidatus Eisenbacteria bacterium]|nr:hypothetical protein [Candidatus Eisenbacteria bacterium]